MSSQREEKKNIQFSFDDSIGRQCAELRATISVDSEPIKAFNLTSVNVRNFAQLPDARENVETENFQVQALK